VGARDGRALCLDLVQAPDVVTVTGDEPKARRLSAAIAGQLVDRGFAVTVVGPAVGRRVTGARLASTLTEAETATDDPTALQVIFCGRADDDAAALVRLTARTSPRTIVVLVGDVRPGRWSVEVGVVSPAGR
jgi:predicted CoA-binding protein